jgi:threonylcarbamoyladenosine tRNA methylthiotransferase MtaB
MIDNTIFENKIAAYYTLGCKLNFAETSSIGKLLSENGVRAALKGEKADVCIINTCSVTELADKKCRRTIRSITKQHPNAKVVVTGCYAQLKPSEVAHIEGVDLVLGSEQKNDIIMYLRCLGVLPPGLDGKRQPLGSLQPGAIHITPANGIRTFSPSCSSDDRTRHFLKVQDGCDYYCSYCTIPFARGRSRNGSIDSILAQAAGVAFMGGREIVLTGVNIGDFGKTTGETFIDLVRALERVDGIARYRISSLEPNLMTGELITFVAGSRKFAPHFHIPLQSGSDEALKLMRRKYNTAFFRMKVDMIRKLMPDAFIGVDVIAGMRGETDELFDETLAFVESLDISQLHVFTYSERPGTKALEIEHAVDPETKHARSRRLLDLSESKRKAFYERHIGQRAAVLFEHARKGALMYGFTANYIKVETAYSSELAGRISQVLHTEWNSGQTALKSTLLPAETE